MICKLLFRLTYRQVGLNKDAFTDGNWLMLPGVNGQYPIQVYDVRLTDSLTIYAPTRKINHRGATLDGAVLVLSCFRLYQM